MNKISITLTLLLILSIGYIIYDKSSESNKTSNSIVNTEDKQLYTCGMHPEIISDEPGLCPICEMKLIPLKTSSQTEAEEGIVQINSSVQQNMNIKTGVIKKEELSKTINTNGILKIAEGRETVINSRFNGWIEKLYVDETNQLIRKGEPLYKIYSPEIYSAEQEFLTTVLALDNGNLSDEVKTTYEVLKNNSIKKLRLLNIPQAAIERIITTQKIDSVITIYSEANGNVIMKNVVEGDYVKEGVKLFHIADLSKLWLFADIYETEIPFINKGDKAEINFIGTGETINAKADFIYPVIDNKSRTVKVRFTIDNPSQKLKPEMLADITIKSSENFNVLFIDEQDIIRSGKENIAVLSLGKGKFKPIKVELGRYFNGSYEVLSGLNEGDVIVKSSQFLIDSESRLKSAYSKFTSVAGHNHSTMQSTNSGNNAEHNTSENENEYGIDSPLIRTGKIDVKSIDENNDGKLFECPMDWNIISDKPGRCPSCEMKLKEYSIDEVKENLTEHGYRLK